MSGSFVRTSLALSLVRAVAAAALAAVASTKQKARGENDRRPFAIIVFTFHERRR